MNYKNITVAGSGVLGSQIAFQTAYKGFHVDVYDISDQVLGQAKERLTKLKDNYKEDLRATQQTVDEAFSRISFYADLAQAVADADLVIEAIPEVAKIKTDFYTQLGKVVRLSQIKSWVWPSVLLAFGNAVFVVAGNTFPSPTLTGIRWAFLAAFFGLTAAGLFSHLRNSRSVARAQLYTAVNIFLLLGLLWATLYLAIDAFSPGSIQIGSHPADRQTELLYFSLVTLSTIGYGDIVPLSGEARIVAALEGVTGVLYIAISVALLVGRFRSEFSD
jgi:voltage-gated potassium channel Kch